MSDYDKLIMQRNPFGKQRKAKKQKRPNFNTAYFYKKDTYVPGSPENTTVNLPYYRDPATNKIYIVQGEQLIPVEMSNVILSEEHPEWYRTYDPWK